jgi:ATP-dependent Clp protease protease subunit
MAKKTDKEIKLQNTTYWIENGIDLINRIIMLDDDVDNFTIGSKLRGLDIMVKEDPKKPITVIINSYGGECYAGLSLYDKIEELKNTPIICYGTGAIMSMGLIIFLAADYRIASKRATFMAHSVSSGTWGKLKDMEIELEESKRLNSLLVDILAEKTKKKYTKNWWEKEIEHKDKYYNVKQAKEMGIITKNYKD